MAQWDFQNKGTRTSPARLSFVLEVPLRHLRPSVIYSVPCDRIVQRAYHGAIYKDLYGINKVLSFLNERGDPPFLFPNLSSYTTNNQ